jgi:hypothetical protein
VIAIALAASAPTNRWLALILLAAVTIWIDIGVTSAIREPAPRNVQLAVKRMLFSIALFDATMIYWKTDEPVLALAVAALVIPAATLGRWIFIT